MFFSQEWNPVWLCTSISATVCWLESLSVAVRETKKQKACLTYFSISLAGFPNKLAYPEFKARYNIIGASAVAKAKNDKAAAGAIMEIVKLDKDKFRLGHTLVFFRAGIGGWMEEQRENKIGSVLAWLQSGARGKASRMQFKKLQDQKMALYSCQRAIRSYMMAKTWLWLQLWLAIKPNLKCTQFGKYKKEYEEKIAIAEANIDKAVADCSAVVEIHTKLSAEKNELVLALSSGGSAVQVTYQNTYSDMTLKFKNMFSGHH